MSSYGVCGALNGADVMIQTVAHLGLAQDNFFEPSNGQVLEGL
ncbi:MAG: hypothetical protein V3W41_02940 [Planctomycetota bacterium]